MIQYTEKNGVGFYHSTLLVSLHAFSTRLGGISPQPPLASLNLAYGRGDNPETVWQNLQRFAYAVGIEPESVISLPQVHGTQVLPVTADDAGRGYAKPANGEGDGYVTAESGVTLGVKSADCVPVLLEARDAHDRVLAVSAVHAGWRGTAGGIVTNAVCALREKCGKDVQIYAAIGPCIGPCCFEVGRDCVDVFESLLGASLVHQCFATADNGKYFGDLRRINRMLLIAAGVPADHINTADVCTCCHPERFFSHRYAAKHTDGVRGTMLSVICKQ